jgi:hypothetical protein
MKTFLPIIGLTTILYSGHAEAKQWYAVNFNTAVCEKADVTPDDVDKYLRKDRNIEGVPNIQVHRDDNGDIFGVEISVTYRNGGSVTLYFTTTMPLCNMLRQELIKSGDLVPRNELR